MGLYSVSNVPGKDKMAQSDSTLRMLTVNYKGKSEFQVFSHSFHNGSTTYNTDSIAYQKPQED